MNEVPSELIEALNYFSANAYNERARNSRIDKFKWLQRIKRFSKRKCE